MEADQLQRSAPPMQTPIGGGNKSRLHMANRAISGHGEDEDGKREGTNFLTITRSLRVIQATIFFQNGVNTIVK